MTVTATRLLRLYPRYWRERYGDEFLALLESTHLTRRRVSGWRGPSRAGF